MIGSVAGSSTSYTLSYTAPSTVNTTSVISAGVSGGADSFVLGDGTKSIIDIWLKQITDMQNTMAQVMKTLDDTNTGIIANLKG